MHPDQESKSKIGDLALCLGESVDQRAGRCSGTHAPQSRLHDLPQGEKAFPATEQQAWEFVAIACRQVSGIDLEFRWFAESSSHRPREAEQKKFDKPGDIPCAEQLTVFVFI
jgi:hypothetical protein